MNLALVMPNSHEVEVGSHESNVCFCLLDAPDEEAVIKHHNKVGISCEWITRVSMTTESLNTRLVLDLRRINVNLINSS